MGCDIHAHGEVKINGEWHHWNQPNISRWYALFARMADVRNYPGDEHIEPIAKPRGLPEDVTFLTKFNADYDGVDGHSHSWLSGEELDDLEAWASVENKKYEGNDDKWFNLCHHAIGYVFGNGWNVKKYPNSYPEGVEDARLVFWFDN
jgi:hypothetical protein